MFKVNELLEATKGKLISGNKDSEVFSISTDSRTIKPKEGFIAIKGNNFDGHDFIKEAIRKKASCIIKESKGKEIDARYSGIDARLISLIEVKDTVKALGDVARYQREKFDVSVIAVTGSNGKTTAKEMIAWVLSEKFRVLKNEGTKNNHIGLPLTLLNLDSSYNFVVLEVGTNHPGEVEYLAKICGPNIGIITNIGPSHLEYFKNLEGVFREKYTLMKYLKNPYTAILNEDDEFLRKEIARNVRKPIIFGFGIKNKSDFFASDIKVLNKRIEFMVNQKNRFTLKTLGYYNIYNALVAIAVSRIFGMEYKDIVSRLYAFSFPQGRSELIKLNKLKFIDDTYNSNPLSLKQALNTLDNLKVKGRKIFVMGDMLELGIQKELFHRQAGIDAARTCDAIITVGELSRLAAEAIKACGFNIKNLFTCASVCEAKDILFKKISPTPDDIVLVKGSRAMKMEEIFE